MTVRAAVVGSGPNGLVAACLLARSGWEVTVYEQAEVPGGAVRSGELLAEGVLSDYGASVFPFRGSSLAFEKLPLEDYGLRWAVPEIAAAHGIDGAQPGHSGSSSRPGAPVLLHQDIDLTAEGLGRDADRWRQIFGPVVENWSEVGRAALTPPTRPFSNGGGESPLRRIHAYLQLGGRGAWSANALNRAFREERSRAFFAGLAGHATMPLSNPLSAAFGVMMGATGHVTGWPFARGGSGEVTRALTQDLQAHGGELRTGFEVTGIKDVALSGARRGVRRNLKRRGYQIEGNTAAGARRRRRSSTEVADVVLLDLTPAQLLQMDGLHMPQRYRRAMRRWDYGPAVVKVDYLVDGPIPWAREELGRAGTVHLGGSAAQLAGAESAVARGVLPGRPYVLLTQPSVADPSRTGDHRHAVWAYAHVPQGTSASAAQRAAQLVDAEIERQAPGFRSELLARCVWTPQQLESWNPNLVGGAISGGSPTLGQFVSRPAAPLEPYTSGMEAIYLCSSSTPPGGGSHGMSGYNAAQRVLREYA